MKIKRAVKCAAKKKQLREALKVAKKANLSALEIQEIFPLMREISLERRAKLIVDYFREQPTTSLAYHFPIKSSFNDIKEAKKFDLASKKGSFIFNLTEKTIREAVLVGKKLGIKTEIPIVVHLFGFVKAGEIKLKNRKEKLKLGEKRLLELKEITDFYNEKTGLKLIITRENNCPDHGKVLGLLDFHPEDIAKTSSLGIGTNLDLAHLWLTILYYQNGRGELPGVDLTKRLYPKIGLKQTIDLLKSSLKLIHLNGAGPGYQKRFEGLEIGRGNLPHSEIIPLLCEKLEGQIMGTYEIKHGHKDPETILKSNQFYQELFKEKFKRYFI